MERNPKWLREKKSLKPRFVSTVWLEEKQRRVIEWYILNNCEEVQPYLE